MVDAEEDERWGEDFRGDEARCNAGRSAWRRSRQPKRVWRRRNAGATMSAGASLGRTAIPGAGGPTSGLRRARAEGQSNFTDPESQIMKTSSEGFQQCTTRRWRSIHLATQVGPQASDQGQLVGMLDEINETFGVEPAVVLADAGYCNEPDLLELEDRGIDAHVALGREQVPGGGRGTAWVSWRAPREPGTATQVVGGARVDQGGARIPTICEAWRRCAASGTSCAWR